MIKALHVTGFWSGNYFYRGYLPAMANGWLVSNEFIDNTNDGQALVRRIDQVDVVQFHRPNNEEIVELMSLVKQKGKKIVFDDDDTFKVGEGVVPQNEEEEEFAERINENRRNALKLADGASCTTDFLRQELTLHNPSTIVLPNCIDKDDAFPAFRRDGKPRILILGSVVSNDDWHIARDAIEAVQDKVTFVLIGVPDRGKIESYDKDLDFWEDLDDVETYPFQPFGNYYNTIWNAGVDLAIAPRKDNYFNRCKSNLKFLEVSLFEIPFMGQAFADGKSPYQVNEQDQYFMKLAYTAEDWKNLLLDFVEDKTALYDMGSKAQEYVINNYDINKHAHKWANFYEKL